MTWKIVACAFGVLFGSACIGLMSVVWGQQGELATQKERVDWLRKDIAEMRCAVEKILDRIEDRIQVIERK